MKLLLSNPQSIMSIIFNNSFGNLSFRCFTIAVPHRSPEKHFMNAVIDKKASDVFISSNVQKLLKKLTGMDLDKVFRKRSLGQRIAPPVYKFMTTEQVKQAEKVALRRANTLLQMPPVVPIRDNKVEILEEMPQIIGNDTTKYVFTDITYGVRDRRRLIVVREPSGILRKATAHERHRMNEIYCHRPGRMLRCPQMFKQENLERLWNEGHFEFILDRLCCQFEPDDPEFHFVAFNTYRKVYEQKAFSKLKSTRHYGPMVFYYVLNKTIDSLLLDYIQNEVIWDARRLIQLYYAVNSDTKPIDNELLETKNDVGYVQAFIEANSSNPDDLLAALQMYIETRIIPAKQINA